MHTLRKKENGTYDVIFCGREIVEIIFADCHFDMALYYVNVLNGGIRNIDKDE